MSDPIEEFKKVIKTRHRDEKMTIDTWRGGKRKSKNVLELNRNNSKKLLYVKYSVKYPGFWGLSTNIAKNLSESGIDWGIVLLVERADCGYYIHKNEIGKASKNVKWSETKKGDIRINEIRKKPGKRKFDFGSATELIETIE